MKQSKRWLLTMMAAAMVMTSMSVYAEGNADAEPAMSEAVVSVSETETAEVETEMVENETPVISETEAIIESETETETEAIIESETEAEETENVELLATKRPQPVTELKVEAIAPKKMKLTWTASASKETEGYLIYAKYGKAGTFKYIGMTGQNTTFTDVKAINTDYNYYRVYAYVKDEAGKMVPSLSDAYVFATFKCDAVQNVRGGSGEEAATIKWDYTPNAEGYLIYGKRGNDGKYGFIGKTEHNYYIDTKAYQTVWNYYWVYPYFTDDQGKMIATQKYTRYAYGHKHYGGEVSYYEGKKCSLCGAVYTQPLPRVYQTPGNYCKVLDSIYIPGCYVSPIRVNRASTREDCIEAMITRAYEYLNAGTTFYEPSSEAPGGHCDCSGLAMQCLLAAGIHMTDMDWQGDITPVTHLWPGHEYESSRMGDSGRFMDVSLANRQRGDLVFYRNSRGTIYHVAIYLGNDYVIDSNSVDWRVNIVPLFRSSYNYTTITVKRPFP